MSPSRNEKTTRLSRSKAGWRVVCGRVSSALHRPIVRQCEAEKAVANTKDLNRTDDVTLSNDNGSAKTIGSP